MANITNGKVVSMHYTLKDASGKEMDSSAKGDPLSYLHGVGQIVPGLEKEIEGMNVGDKKNVIVQPKDGYGEVNPDLRQSVDRSMFPKEQALQEGMQFGAELASGDQVIFTIKKIETDKVHIDGNHPLAGQTLHFDIEIVEVRDATEEEIEHGHVHGPGGHHH